MSNRQRIMENFSRAATQYDRLAQLQHRQSAKMAKLAMQYVPEQATIIDIGCGTGQFAVYAVNARPDWNIIGLDFAYGMCREAASRCPVAQADAEALPVASHSCDAVVSSLCLQWLDPLTPAITEINRALIKEGIAIIVTLGSQTLRELHATSAAAELSLRLRTLLPSEAYRKALEAQNFEILHAEQEIETEYYDTVRAMLDSMRDIGAGGDAEKMQGFAGATKWRKMLEQYELLRTEKGLPMSWEHVIFVARKRA